MYCHTSSSVQFEIGNTRSVSPLRAPGVVDLPQLRTLPLRIPLVLGGADREDALLGPRLLLVTPGPAEAQVVLVVVDDLLEPLGLPHVGVHGRAVVERVDPAGDALRVLVHDEVDTEPGRRVVAELVHVAELPRGVDVHQRERRLRRVERLHRQVQHDRAVLADRVEHRRVVALRHRLAHDLDGFGLEPLQMRQPAGRQAFCRGRRVGRGRHAVAP